MEFPDKLCSGLRLYGQTSQQVPEVPAEQGRIQLLTVIIQATTGNREEPEGLHFSYPRHFGPAHDAGRHRRELDPDRHRGGLVQPGSGGAEPAVSKLLQRNGRARVRGREDEESDKTRSDVQSNQALDLRNPGRRHPRQTEADSSRTVRQTEASECQLKSDFRQEVALQIHFETEVNN